MFVIGWGGTPTNEKKTSVRCDMKNSAEKWGKEAKNTKG